MKWETATEKWAGERSWIKPAIWKSSGESMYEHYTGRGANDIPCTTEDPELWERILKKWIEDRVRDINLHAAEDLDMGQPLRNSDFALAGPRALRMAVSHNLKLLYKLKDGSLRCFDSYAEEEGPKKPLTALRLIERAQEQQPARIGRILGIVDETWVETRRHVDIFFDVFECDVEWNKKQLAALRR